MCPKKRLPFEVKRYCLMFEFEWNRGWNRGGANQGGIEALPATDLRRTMLTDF